MTETLPEAPVLVRCYRGAHVESEHRASWVLTDAVGSVLEAAGDPEGRHFMRSATKSLQALPLFETGAAERYALGPEETALALASHNAEACHQEVVRRVLERVGLGVDALDCGAQRPGDPQAQRALEAAGEAPSALHNNCSGKHAGFLALARHLGEDPAGYLDPACGSQQLVRAAVREMTGLEDEAIDVAVDGCSAPTFRFALRGLATAFARVANPEGLATPRREACERMLDAVAAHPVLIAGSHKRICTDIARVTGGRLFPKIGAEGVYGIGVRGGDRGLAIKMQDGAWRGLYPLILHLLRRFALASEDELEALSSWAAGPLHNWAGREVGRVEVVDP